MHGIIKSGKPDVLRSYLSYNHEHVYRDTRQSHVLAVGRAKNNHGMRRFVHRAASLYNRMALQNGLAGLSVATFSAKIKELLRQSSTVG